MIKPASSSCNLHCRYCFYIDESKQRGVFNHGIMKQETVKTLIDRIAEEMDEKGDVHIAFQGGEPLIARLDFFEEFVRSFSKYPA